MKENSNKNPKYRPLQKMFMEVPARYDLLNRLLTWRFDESWRKKTVDELLKDKPRKALDLCTGTGDLLLRMASHPNSPPELKGLDYSKPMLEVLRKKAKKMKIDRFELVHGDAANMPFEDNYFDAVGIAFAFRNLTFRNPDRDKFLKEIFRVIHPGGKFVIIESSRPKSGLFAFMFNIYLDLMVERIGGALSGHKTAYKYLAHSARNYYRPNEVNELLHNAGFHEVSHRQFFGGISALHVAIK